MFPKNFTWGALAPPALLIALAAGGWTVASPAPAAPAAITAPRCFHVAFESTGKPMVTPASRPVNSTICGVVGEPGTRQVVEAIQGQLKAKVLASKNPAPIVILNIMLAEEKSNG